MTETELYKELAVLTRNKNKWEDSVPYLYTLLDSDSDKIKAKALWLLGESGLAYPHAVKNYIPAIASFLADTNPLLRERAINAIGRIGRADYEVIEPYWAELFGFAKDTEATIRLSFIWASENIATNTPDPYCDYMPVFSELLHDSDDRVRMEAPEIFRVIGKRRPTFVEPYTEMLKSISETDENRVVRIHALGALNAINANICSRFRRHFPA